MATVEKAIPFGLKKNQIIDIHPQLKSSEDTHNTPSKNWTTKLIVGSQAYANYYNSIDDVLFCIHSTSSGAQAQFESVDYFDFTNVKYCNYIYIEIQSGNSSSVTYVPCFKTIEFIDLDGNIQSFEAKTIAPAASNWSETFMLNLSSLGINITKNRYKIRLNMIGNANSVGYASIIYKIQLLKFMFV